MSLKEFSDILYSIALDSISHNESIDTVRCFEAAQSFGETHCDEPNLLFDCAASLMPENENYQDFCKTRFVLKNLSDELVKGKFYSYHLQQSITTHLSFVDSFELYKKVTIHFHRNIMAKSKASKSVKDLSGQVQTLQTYVKSKKCSAESYIDIIDAWASSEFKYNTTESHLIFLYFDGMDGSEIDGIPIKDALIQSSARFLKCWTMDYFPYNIFPFKSIRSDSLLMILSAILKCNYITNDITYRKIALKVHINKPN